jgi:hypothetical protein
MYLDAVKWLSNQGNYTLNLTFGNGIMSVKIYSCTILLYGFYFYFYRDSVIIFKLYKSKIIFSFFLSQ